MSKSKPQSPSSVKDIEINTRAFMADANKRLTLLATVSVIGLLCLIIALWMMIPLKQSVPYIVTVNPESHQVYLPDSQTVSEFRPQWANIEFFLRRWITDLFVINRYVTVNISDPRAQTFLRGRNAIAEYKAFREKDKTFAVMAEYPSLIRSVDILSFAKVAGTDNGVVARIRLTRRYGGGTRVEEKLITIYYEILPSTDRSELKKNPIGIYIVDFKVSNQ